MPTPETRLNVNETKWHLKTQPRVTTSPEPRWLVSMAKTFVVFATYLSLSLAQDRLARSGDLDRGPINLSAAGIVKIAESNAFTTRSIDFFGSDSEESPTNLVLNKKYNNNNPLVNHTFTKRGRAEGTKGVSYISSVPIEPLRLNRLEVWNSSSALKRRLELSTEFFLVPSTDANPSFTTPQHSIYTACAGCTVKSTKIGAFFRDEVWVVPVLSLSAVTMMLIAGFEVFVLCKAYYTTPSRRHLFLGQMLLLGLFSGAALASVFTASPTQFTCAIVRFGTGVTYAIIFASLLVKCVFLVSLNGGVYLPAPYQGLLLLFAILIQVAIGAQWLLTNPPIVDEVTFDNVMLGGNKYGVLVTAEDLGKPVTVHLCRTPFMDMLFSLIYVIFLVVFVTVLAVKSRGIRDNYREATYIGMSVGCSIMIWVIWTMSGFIVHERHKDACIAFGLVVSSIVVFLIMFMPKGRQLAAMGKEGVYVEDREERFSSLSRAGSGYSPSFFHFKPVKYGLSHGSSQKIPPVLTTVGPGGVFLSPDDGNVYTTLEPTMSSNPNVYFQRGAGLHPGMMY
ncbi:uncharacterized protein LOC123322881 isoform X2 [Coccinella septempunctata]|uniref:uncharacterized protein LOC123322881 isoform X2 n=1 Tax=Coccinella septempunctata TaxID=41139 RepID=UPI001D06E5CD|nr:uncharacterized protein LOC123322881 isoform X2 [Coccinella septempunctata]